MKIYGIGLSRTGTKSLAKALTALGYKTGHYDVTIKAVVFGEDEPTLDVNLVRQWDALTDIPIAAFYRQLDALFPNAKFILTIRDRANWLDSCERHYQASRIAYSNKHGIQPEQILQLRRYVYGQTVFERNRFSHAYEAHVNGVLEYFTARPNDLLVMNICSGAAWSKLCAFLGKDVPNIPFPRENLSKA